MNQKHADYDVVIVGSGAGALVAALRAHALGMSPVILEKQSKVGGSSALSGGVMWIPGNPAQARAGVRDSYDSAWTYLMSLIGTTGGLGATPERWRRFLRTGPQMITFLESQGIPFLHCAGRSDYHDELPGGNGEGRSVETPIFNGRKLGDWLDRLLLSSYPYPVRGSEMRYALLAQARLKGAMMGARILVRYAIQKLLGRHYLGMGGSLVGHLLKAVLDAGIPVLSEMAVSRLKTNDGRVTGVFAIKNNQELEFTARRGVLLAAGGFSRNAQLRERYGPHPTQTDWTISNPGDTGEVLLSAVEVGAAVDKMDFFWWLPISILPEGIRALHVADIAKPGCIVVDQAANRFVDEAGSYISFGQAMYHRHQTQAAIPAWCIMDHRNRSRYPWATRLPFQTPDHWFSTGYMKRADTLEGLAQACGLDPEKLLATVGRFNSFVDSNKDQDFNRGGRQYDKYYADPYHRPSPTLGRIDQPPFYAVNIFPGDLGTAGGLVCDDQARVMREDGSIIPGLYATGNITAPVFGATYPGAGATIAPSAVFGYVAAASLAGNQTAID